MEFIALGRTNLRVSRLSLGTAAFGLERYGFCDSDEPSTITEDAAIKLIRAAVDQGINFVDTARGYGRSESIVGKALSGLPDCVISTKVSVPENILSLGSSALQQTVMASLDTSLRELRRDVIDIAQIHNATASMLEDGQVVSILETARQQGKLRFIGASVYGVENALAVVHSGRIDVLQLAVSLLDQRMLTAPLPDAKQNNVGTVARSVFLKGALTDRASLLPRTMVTLANAADRARQILGDTWSSLPESAVRFCLSVAGVHSVLMGLRSLEELQSALRAEQKGCLSSEMMAKTAELKLTDEKMLNPSHWPVH